MADMALYPPVESLSQLYLDVLWNLASKATMLRVKLPAFASAASDPELVALLGDALGRSTEAANTLEATASRFERPGRMHAAELETLLGTVATEIAGWHAGKPRDVALTSVLRSAIHLSIPACELCISLAPVVGYPAHERVFARILNDVTTLDGRLRAIIYSLLGTHATTQSRSPGTIVAQAEDLVHSRTRVPDATQEPEPRGSAQVKSDAGTR
jgi:Domain of unknown function (DUF892)